MKAVNGDYKKHYKDKLKEGLEYQDFVRSILLYERGLVVLPYMSRKYQIEHGENVQGIEIKRDGNFMNTGNLYIETAEKSNPENRQYVDSGIMREDNSWLFVIGDEGMFWAFTVTMLLMLRARKNYAEIENRTKTSKGFLLPISDADRYCAFKWCKQMQMAA